MMDVKKLVSSQSDEALLDIFKELDTGVVPATGYAHTFCRKANRRIDEGTLCINPSAYRKVYLPTLIKFVTAELAHRYAEAVKVGGIEL